MIKFTQGTVSVAVLCVGLLLFLNVSQASTVRPVTPDLTASVWRWSEEDASFVLTFTQGKPETKGVTAILNGWGNDPLELRGEYSENASEPLLHLTGSYEGETIAFDLKFNPGDHERQPFLYGEFSIGSEMFSISAGCDKQCPDITSRKSDESDFSNANSAGTALTGEWRDDSEAMGFKERWSIKLIEGQWQVSGQFLKGKEVVGSFRGEEVSFDPEKGVLYFQQVFDRKPDENWLDSNNIEVTAQGDTLKFEVRGAEGILTRKSGGAE